MWNVDLNGTTPWVYAFFLLFVVRCHLWEMNDALRNISQGCGGWKQMAWAAGRLTALHVAFWSILRWERAEEESTKSTRRRKVRGLIFRTERLAATRWRHVWESAWIFFGLIRETNLGLIRSPFIIAASLHSHTYIQRQYGIMEGVHVQLPVRLP